MGLPINIGIYDLYVIEAIPAGPNSKLQVTRLSDNRVEFLLMSQPWWNFLDGLCGGPADIGVLQTLCDGLFA